MRKIISEFVGISSIHAHMRSSRRVWTSLYCKCNYCLLYGISDILLRRLQAIQNAAARLFTGMVVPEGVTT